MLVTKERLRSLQTFQFRSEKEEGEDEEAGDDEEEGNGEMRIVGKKKRGHFGTGWRRRDEGKKVRNCAEENTMATLHILAEYCIFSMLNCAFIVRVLL